MPNDKKIQYIIRHNNYLDSLQWANPIRRLPIDLEPTMKVLMSRLLEDSPYDVRAGGYFLSLIHFPSRTVLLNNEAFTLTPSYQFDGVCTYFTKMILKHEGFNDV